MRSPDRLVFIRTSMEVARVPDAEAHLLALADEVRREAAKKQRTDAREAKRAAKRAAKESARAENQVGEGAARPFPPPLPGGAPQHPQRAPTNPKAVLRNTTE